MTIQSDIKAGLPPRKKDCHKGNCGRLLFLCGSRGLTGAACLAAEAALRSGAGLVTLVVPESLNTVFETKLTEVMTLPIPDARSGALLLSTAEAIASPLQRMDAVAIGPGLGCHNETVALVKQVSPSLTVPQVLDADGLNAFVGHTALFMHYVSPCVITPHPGEFDRLFGTNVSCDLQTRQTEAERVANECGLTVVLKGQHTIVAAPSQETYVNETGNPGMATAGTGDCLCGIITAFLGFGLSPYDAARFGVYIHGLAGDLAARDYGEYSLIASDLLTYVPRALNAVQQ